MNPEKTLPIHELFATFQGEGAHMGRSAFFVRTFGCPVKCPWCDAAGTWHPDWIPKHIQRMTADEIVSQVQTGPIPEFVVVTGGEPAIHDLAPLRQALRDKLDLPFHLETSGGFPIKVAADWITLSPKKWKPPTDFSVDRANEFKFIIEEPQDILFYHQMLQKLDGELYWQGKPVWLHPEWTHHEDPVVLGAISDAVKEGRGMFRAGWQLHKLYRVDFRDTRIQPMAPIGGDARKGY